MTAPVKETTAITRAEKKNIIDLNGEKANRRFLEAFGKGQLDKLSPEEQAHFLIALGAKIGVRAELGELMLYQGKPYVTLAGYRRIAHETGLLAGIEPKPASSVERLQFGAEEGEIVWVARVWKKGAHRAFVGWGVAGGARDKNPVSKQYPREMSRKRAIYDALRLAFPPDEIIGDIHLKYIAEAEAQAERTKVGSAPAIVNYESDIGGTDEAPDVVVEKDNEESATDENGNELALGDRRRESANTAIRD